MFYIFLIQDMYKSTPEMWTPHQLGHFQLSKGCPQYREVPLYLEYSIYSVSYKGLNANLVTTLIITLAPLESACRTYFLFLHRQAFFPTFEDHYQGRHDVWY